MNKLDRLIHLEIIWNNNKLLNQDEQLEREKLREEFTGYEKIIKRLQKELADEEKTFKQLGELLKKYLEEGNISAGNLLFDQLESQYRDLKRLRETLKLDIKPIIEEIKHGTN